MSDVSEESLYYVRYREEGRELLQEFDQEWEMNSFLSGFRLKYSDSPDSWVDLAFKGKIFVMNQKDDS